jgi:hypothetical protein
MESGEVLFEFSFIPRAKLGREVSAGLQNIRCHSRHIRQHVADGWKKRRRQHRSPRQAAGERHRQRCPFLRRGRGASRVRCDAGRSGLSSGEDIAGSVRLRGQRGTVLRRAIQPLDNAPDFPHGAPVLIVIDGDATF